MKITSLITAIFCFAVVGCSTLNEEATHSEDSPAIAEASTEVTTEAKDDVAEAKEENTAEAENTETAEVADTIEIPALTESEKATVEDHNACKEQGFYKLEDDNPETADYYRCRVSEIEKALNKMSSGILVGSERTLYNDRVSEARSFRHKAKKVHEAYLDALDSWEIAEQEKADEHTDADDKTCRESGYSPDVIEEASAEKYYNCRARLIYARAEVPPYGDDKTPPEIAMEFQMQSEEAREKYLNLIDHEACLARGHYPGAKGAPGTKKYYDCRSEMANRLYRFSLAADYRDLAGEEDSSESKSE